MFVKGCFRHRRKDRSLINVEVSANAMVFIGRLSRFVCSHDVTEQVRVEASLRERKAELRRAQEMAQLAHNITGPDGVFESRSECLPRMIGMSADQMPKTARAWLSLVHPDDHERFRSVLVEGGRSGKRPGADRPRRTAAAAADGTRR